MQVVQLAAAEKAAKAARKGIWANYDPAAAAAAEAAAAASRAVRKQQKKKKKKQKEKRRRKFFFFQKKKEGEKELLGAEEILWFDLLFALVPFCLCGAGGDDGDEGAHSELQVGHPELHNRPDDHLRTAG